MQPQLTIALFALAIVIFIIVRHRQGIRSGKEAESRQAEALARQEDVLKELIVLGDLIKDSSLSESEKIGKAKASIAIMEANNTDGNFTEVIESSKQYFFDKTQQGDGFKHAINKLLPETAQAFSPARISLDSDVDPLAEAEVYLFYGRKKQAVEVLKEGLIKNPARAEIREKLIELGEQ